MGLEFLLGFGLALILVRKFPGRGLILTLMLTPMMLAPVIVGLFWKFMLDASFGVINYMQSAWFHLPRVDYVNQPSTAIRLDDRGRRVDVDAVHAAHLGRRPLGHPQVPDRGGAGGSRLGLVPFPPYHAAAGLAAAADRVDLPHHRRDQALRPALHPDRRRPGQSTLTVSYLLYTKAFNDYDTGSSCALAYIILIMVIALANIYIRNLNKATAA